MGVYTEKKRQLIEKIKDYDAHIRSNMEKKKKAMEKLKEVSRLAMAEEYNCKPQELDEIIEQEHSIMQKLRASGLSDEEFLEMVGITVANNSSASPDKNVNVEGSIDSEDDGTADDSISADDEIRFYDESDRDNA